MRLPFLLLCVSGSLAVCQAAPVRLHITGSDGKAIVGAQVRVLETEGYWFQPEFLAPRDLSSDDEGNVAFESQGTASSTPQTASDTSVWARVVAPGFAVGAVQLKARGNLVALAPGRRFEGVVLDRFQKPVADARLVLEWVGNAQNKAAPPFDALSLEARTDAQGHWEFDSLPSVGRARLRVQDARFKSQSFELDLAQKAPPLFLERGTTVKGRLLKPDGTPAGGVRLFAGDYQHTFATDDNGRFEATGLSESSVYLQDGHNDQLPFMVVPRRVTDLEKGEVRDIGDWKTVKGIRVTGRTVIASTGKAIAGAQISIWGKSMVIREATSDKTGAFALTVAPDSDILSVRAPGYVDLSQRGLITPRNGVIAFGSLSLQSAYQVSGVVVDAAGNPVKGVSLYAERGTAREYAHSDSKTGAFTFKSLSQGAYTVKVQGYKQAAPVKFTAGADSKASLRVVVQGKSQSEELVPMKAVGRVEDDAGQGVAGAIVDVLFGFSGGGRQIRSAVSQSDGTFALQSPYVGTQVTARVFRIYRPGYLRLKDEVVDSQDSGFRITATMQKRGSMLKGRVVDAQGNPVKNAFVALQNSEDLPVSVNTEGAFMLEDVPATGVTVLASNGPSLASFEVEKAGQEITLVLPEAAPRGDKSAMADGLLQEARLTWGWKKFAPTLGPQRLHELMKKGGGSGLWGQYLDYLAHHETRFFLDNESELRTVTDRNALYLFEYLRLLSCARSGNEEQRAEVRSWLKAQEAEKRDISPESVEVLLRVAEIAARLDDKEGQMWLDYAVQLNDQLGLKSGGKNTGLWGVWAARISPDAPRLLSSNWSTTAQIQLFASAMQTWREDKNVDAARASWSKIEALGADLEKYPVARMRNGDLGEQPDELLNQAKADYALLLSSASNQPKYATTNLTGELFHAAMVMKAPSGFDFSVLRKQDVLVTLASTALRNQDFALIEGLLNPVLSIRSSDAAVLAKAATSAEGLNKGFGAKFWTRAYSKARPDGDEGNISDAPTMAPYAIASADRWPGESRLLIEREWAKRLRVAPEPETDEDDSLTYNQSVLSDLTEAMAKVAPARAIEMLERVPDKDHLRAWTRTKIAVVLLTK